MLKYVWCIAPLRTITTVGGCPSFERAHFFALFNKGGGANGYIRRTVSFRNSSSVNYSTCYQYNKKEITALSLNCPNLCGQYKNRLYGSLN